MKSMEIQPLLDKRGRERQYSGYWCIVVLEIQPLLDKRGREPIWIFNQITFFNFKYNRSSIKGDENTFVFVNVSVVVVNTTAPR